MLVRDLDRRGFFEGKLKWPGLIVFSRMNVFKKIQKS